MPFAPPFCSTEMYSTGEESHLICIFIMAAVWATMAPILPVRGETTRVPGVKETSTSKENINQAPVNETINAPLGDTIDDRSWDFTDLVKTRGISAQPFWSAARPDGDSPVTSICNGMCVCTRSTGGEVKVECTKPGTLLTLPDLGPENANVTEL